MSILIRRTTKRKQAASGAAELQKKHEVDRVKKTAGDSRTGCPPEGILEAKRPFCGSHQCGGISWKAADYTRDARLSGI